MTNPWSPPEPSVPTPPPQDAMHAPEALRRGRYAAGLIALAGMIGVASIESLNRVSVGLVLIGPVALVLGFAGVVHPPLMYGIGPRRGALRPWELWTSRAVFASGFALAAVLARWRWGVL